MHYTMNYVSTDFPVSARSILESKAGNDKISVFEKCNMATKLRSEPAPF